MKKEKIEKRKKEKKWKNWKKQRKNRKKGEKRKKEKKKRKEDKEINVGDSAGENLIHKLRTFLSYSSEATEPVEAIPDGIKQADEHAALLESLQVSLLQQFSSLRWRKRGQRHPANPRGYWTEMFSM